MPLAEDQDMIQTVAPDRPDQALSIRGYRVVANSHRPDSPCKGFPVSAIIVAHQVARNGFPGEGLGDLSRQPLRRRVLPQSTYNYTAENTSNALGIVPLRVSTRYTRNKVRIPAATTQRGGAWR